jgi:hypothetical protein
MKWYLSFVNHGKFAGACVVEAPSFEEAICEAWRLKINPGGEVAGFLIDKFKQINLPLNRLMDRAELDTYGPTIRRGDMEHPPQQIGLN